MRNGAISLEAYVASRLPWRVTMIIRIPLPNSVKRHLFRALLVGIIVECQKRPRLVLPPPDRVRVMTDKPHEVGLSSAGTVLAFTAAELDYDVLVRFDEGTIWLTQALMADLFGVDVRTVKEHFR